MAACSGFNFRFRRWGFVCGESRAWRIRRYVQKTLWIEKKKMTRQDEGECGLQERKLYDVFPFFVDESWILNVGVEALLFTIHHDIQFRSLVLRASRTWLMFSSRHESCIISSTNCMRILLLVWPEFKKIQTYYGKYLLHKRGSRAQNNVIEDYIRKGCSRWN